MKRIHGAPARVEGLILTWTVKVRDGVTVMRSAG